MSNIIDLQISVNKDEEEKFIADNFRSVPGNLNKGNGGNAICLWYKRGKDHGITRIEFSFNNKMSENLNSAGYQKIEKNLNTGAGGEETYLWFYRQDESSSTSHYDRIMALHVTTQADDEPELYRLGWERVGYDLNQKPEEPSVHLWVRRSKATYICDIKVCVNFDEDLENLKSGYIRVAETTNRNSSEEKAFIWYRETDNPKIAIRDLLVSSDDPDDCTQAYKKLDHELSTDITGKKTFLWYTTSDKSSPIRGVTVLTKDSAVKANKDAGNHVAPIDPNSSSPVYLWFCR